jgi:KUP system potassium uptake protein
MEEITTKNVFWRMFAMVKRLTPPFVQFYDLPSEKLHGVVQRIEM